MTWLRERMRDEEGQALAEYGLYLALVVAVCVLAVAAYSLALVDLYDLIESAFP